MKGDIYPQLCLLMGVPKDEFENCFKIGRSD